MTDIAALMRALPISGLEPDIVALLDGFIDVPKAKACHEHVRILEPPAGQHVPYIEPINLLDKLIRHQGVSPEAANAQAVAMLGQMREEVADHNWVRFFDDLEPNSPECLPVPSFIAWLRANGKNSRSPNPERILIAPEILDFIEQAARVASHTSMFRGPDNWDKAWSLEQLPKLPPAKAMIEYVPSPCWADFEDHNWIDDPGAYYPIYKPFQRWREAMRPIAQRLEAALGEPVYYFADLSCETDDDSVHRFLVLHWCCTHKPDSPFVRYLLKVSGAREVADLKAALTDPANYSHAFEMNDSFFGLDALCCHMNYLPQNTRKTVGVVFLTEQAREVAQSLLAQQIGAHAFIVAPKALATDKWIHEATRTCRDWSLRYVYENTLDAPIDILAAVDEICVIANEPTTKSGFDLKLSDPVEDLLWLALDQGVGARYYLVDGSNLMDPEVSLEKRGVPARVAARKAARTEFTRTLRAIHLTCDFCSSGLWDAEGRMLSYDQLDLPLSLIKRICSWQENHDDTIDPPDAFGSDAWWRKHEQEEFAIAKDMQVTLGERPIVKLDRKQNWISVDEILSAKGGAP